MQQTPLFRGFASQYARNWLVVFGGPFRVLSGIPKGGAPGGAGGGFLRPWGVSMLFFFFEESKVKVWKTAMVLGDGSLMVL